MRALNDATIRYRDAGLCSEPQRSLLAASLGRDEAAIVALDEAVAAGRPLTLAQFDALADREIEVDDRTRYAFAFGGYDPRINDFAMPTDELAAVTARALERGTPMTEDEIASLERDVEPGLLY